MKVSGWRAVITRVNTIFCSLEESLASLPVVLMRTLLLACAARLHPLLACCGVIGWAWRSAGAPGVLATLLAAAAVAAVWRLAVLAGGRHRIRARAKRIGSAVHLRYGAIPDGMEVSRVGP